MINWSCKKFEELSVHELYAIMQLRNEVFVVEQDCVYQDADNKDQLSFHFMGWEAGQLVAYTRILPPGVAYPQPSIGRVVTSPASRRSGLGRELMKRTIEQTSALFNNESIRIGAQAYLRNFYTELGFEPTGKSYLEDGIEHIEMLRQ